MEINPNDPNITDLGKFLKSADNADKLDQLFTEAKEKIPDAEWPVVVLWRDNDTGRMGWVSNMTMREMLDATEGAHFALMLQRAGVRTQ